MSVRINDGSSVITRKHAVIARSGKYIYTADEVRERGLSPVKDKDFYVVYRPPGVIADALDMYRGIVFTKDHPKETVSPSNFKQYAEGCIGDDLKIVSVKDSQAEAFKGVDCYNDANKENIRGEIGIEGTMSFWSQSAFDYYNDGNRDISVGYVADEVAVPNPDEVGYDILMTKIREIDHVCICEQGRGGAGVSIKDCVKDTGGEIPMEKLTKSVLDSVKKNESVDDFISKLEKKPSAKLEGAIRSVFDSNPVNLLLHKNDIASVLDGLAKAEEAEPATPVAPAVPVAPVADAVPAPTAPAASAPAKAFTAEQETLLAQMFAASAKSIADSVTAALKPPAPAAPAPAPAPAAAPAPKGSEIDDSVIEDNVDFDIDALFSRAFA